MDENSTDEEMFVNVVEPTSSTAAPFEYEHEDDDYVKDQPNSQNG